MLKSDRMKITNIWELLGLSSYLVIIALFLQSPRRGEPALGWEGVVLGIIYFFLNYLNSKQIISDRVFKILVWNLLAITLPVAIALLAVFS